jgi:nucleoid-associated protein YgaU
MLVDIVQTFDEQAFDSDAVVWSGTPGDRAEQEREALMSAMVMGPAMPSPRSMTIANRRPSPAARRATSSGRPSRLAAPTVRSAPAVRPVASAPAVPSAAAVRSASTASVPAAGSHLRLTARGRAVLWFLAACVVAVVTLLASQASADGPVAAQEVVRHVVQPGETLWQIAESVAEPSQDVRDVVVNLVALNELPDAGLMAGQVIVVPAG